VIMILLLSINLLKSEIVGFNPDGLKCLVLPLLSGL